MNHTEVLVLNGSPGSGKTTLANVIAEWLRQRDIPHAVIDVDELARVYPEVGSSIGWHNLRAMWPNYAALPNLKVILSVCIDSKRDLEELRNAAPSSTFTICELVADELVLKRRVTRREPNEYWQTKLRKLVERHLGKDATDRFGDFRVRTDDHSVDEAAEQILNRLGWKPIEPKGPGIQPQEHQNIELTMERVALDDLPTPVNDAPCTIRDYRSGDEVSWTRIQAAADHHNTITSTLFTREFGDDLTEHTRRILFAVSPRQELVGVSAAWWGSSSADEWGRVHWVAVLPAWQRQGIGRKLLVATCNRLRQLGHKKAFLTTSPVRAEALRLYRSLGFMPRIIDSADREVWREVASRIGDSTLSAWLTTQLRIRRATLNDVPRLWALRRESILKLAPKGMSVAQSEAWAEAKTLQGMENQFREIEIWTAEANDTIVGWVGFHADYVDGLYTDPQFIERGIGTRLLGVAEALMQERGVQAIRADASWNAEEFYYRRGYEPTASRPADGARPFVKHLPQGPKS